MLLRSESELLLLLGDDGGEGDRVVFLGGALIEHEQAGGYIETMLTTYFPQQNVAFRNLGYSGDTVSGATKHDIELRVTGWNRHG